MSNKREEDGIAYEIYHVENEWIENQANEERFEEIEMAIEKDPNLQEKHKFFTEKWREFQDNLEGDYRFSTGVPAANATRDILNYVDRWLELIKDGKDPKDIDTIMEAEANQALEEVDLTKFVKDRAKEDFQDGNIIEQTEHVVKDILNKLSDNPRLNITHIEKAVPAAVQEYESAFVEYDSGQREVEENSSSFTPRKTFTNVSGRDTFGGWGELLREDKGRVIE